MSIDPCIELIQRAETAMLQAEFASPEMREPLWLEAKDALIQCEMHSPGRGAWLMACLNARMGSVALARKWLERAESSGTLPPGLAIAASPYTVGLRDLAWFQELIARLP